MTNRETIMIDIQTTPYLAGIFMPVLDHQKNAINQLCEIVNNWATLKGWNEDPLEGLSVPAAVRERIELAFKNEQLALITSEISECLEYLRIKQQPAMDDKVPSLTGEAAELADIVIRVAHYAGRHGIDLGAAIQIKHAFNSTRPAKHGKAC